MPAAARARPGSRPRASARGAVVDRPRERLDLSALRLAAGERTPEAIPSAIAGPKTPMNTRSSPSLGTRGSTSATSWPSEASSSAASRRPPIVSASTSAPTGSSAVDRDAQAPGVAPHAVA